MTLAQHVTEEACEALYSEGLDANSLSVAMGFVPTLRVKKWKPRLTNSNNTRNKSSSSQRCYIDSDVANQKADYLVASGLVTCSKEDPLFRDAPFITRVFEDQQQDVSQNFPFKKCVLELDTGQVSQDNLQAFWKRVGSTECDALYADVHREVQQLKRTLQATLQEVRALKEKSDGQAAAIHTHGATKTGLTESILQLEARITAIQVDTRAVEAEHSRLQAHYAKMQQEFDAQLAQLRQQVRECEGSTASSTARLQLLLSQAQALSRGMKEMRADMHERTLYLKSLKSANQAKEAEATAAQAMLQQVEKELRECRPVRSACSTNLAACMAQRQQLRDDVTRLSDRLTDSTEELQMCQVSRARLADALSRTRGEVGRHRDSLQAMEDAWRLVQREVQAKKAECDKLESILEDWRKNRMSCEPVILEIENVKAEIRALLEWCRLQSDLEKTYGDQNAQVLPLYREDVQQKCDAAAAAMAMTPAEYFGGSVLRQKKFSVRDGWDAKNVLVGTWDSVIGSGFAYATALAYMDGAADYLGPIVSGGSGHGLVPKFDGPTASEGETLYLWVGPIFTVSKDITGTFATAMADDEVFLWINGNLQGKAKNSGAGDKGKEPLNFSVTYTFKKNYPYLIAVAHSNGGGAGVLTWTAGGENVYSVLRAVKTVWVDPATLAQEEADAK